MFIGFLCALGAGLLWGLVFVAPLMLGDYPGLVLSFGRYLGFGLIALVPAYLDRRRIAALSKADWIVALKLSLVGPFLMGECRALARVVFPVRMQCLQNQLPLRFRIRYPV